METETRAIGSDFGTLLRHYRLAAGLSQEALAERAQLSIEGVSALERGYRRTPQFETVARLAGALALTTEQRLVFAAAADTRAWRGRGSVTAGRWPEVRKTVLPIATTSFIGRDPELAEIATLLRDYRMVTLLGAGGIGKTQTALRVALAPRDEDFGTIVFVPLAPVANPSHVVAAIATALGVQEMRQHPLLDTLLAYLGNKKLLLVVDNAEHLIEEAARVVETLLRGATGLRVLATSRVAFNAGGERVYLLSSLALDDAVRLFVDRAQAVDDQFTLTNANEETVTELCRRLDGIPLAIELAAARTGSLPIAALTQHLEKHLVLAGPASSALTRHQTMHATIEWSYSLLSSGERRVFERFSVFAGGGTLAAATVVCAGDDIVDADVADLIASLVTKSLLVADLEYHEPRYRLLEPFRAYAREQLATHGDYDATAHLHALACLERANRFMSAYENEPDCGYRPIAESELDNWRVALDWTLVKGHNILLGQQIAGKLSALWWLSGRYAEGRQWAHLALELTDESTPQRVVADLLRTCADVALNAGPSEEIISACNRALSLYSAIGDRPSVAWVLTNLAVAYLDSDAHRARALIEGSLALARQEKSWRVTIAALRLRAMAKALDGDLAAGRSDAEKALRIAQEHNDHYEAMFAKMEFAACCWDDPERGVQYLTPMAQLSPFPLRLDLLAFTLSRLSIYSLLLQQYDEALAKAREAIKLDGLHEKQSFTDNALTIIAITVTLQPQMIEGNEAANSVRAAKLLGFASERDSFIGRPVSRTRVRFDEALALLADSIGKARLERLMAEGSAMTREQAISEALALCG
jgi:predicted ATPase/DNA-binding XRE family transcriptional regulator